MTSLPPNMVTKIAIEICPVAGLPGFCWTWTGALNSKGYGCIGVNGKSQLSHRVAYTIFRGPIPAGLQIDHLCDNRRCCNPDHLEAVTPRTNARRRNHSTKSLCKRGHRLDADNVIVKKAGKYVIRNCRSCTNERKRVKAA